MRKIFKNSLLAVGALLALLLVGLVVSFLVHQSRLKDEEPLFQPLGQIVDVNGHRMSVYTEGTGDQTLVFLAGGGTSSPILDFKTLYSQFSDQYRIVVIEKQGYGFSDVTNEPRDIASILEESRAALLEVGIEGPYILLPHSMSGIEALYWAQQYPREIQAIVGLDMALPQTYEQMSINPVLVQLGKFAADAGLTRWFYDIDENDAIAYGELSEQEKEIYRAVFYRRTLTQNMVNEVKEIQTNARIVAQNAVPNIPYLFLVSNGEGTGWERTQWQKFSEDFVSATPNSTLVTVEASHYLHNSATQTVAEEIHRFVDGLMR